MPKIILIAEDYDDVREFMIFILHSRGFQVYAAENGQEAVKIAEKNLPDLILMDISMPVMDGLQATRLIRASEEKISQVPIIAVTAFDKSYREKALAAGCNQVISKPVDFDELDETIDKYLTV